jgi:hypothetical protein
MNYSIKGLFHEMGISIREKEMASLLANIWLYGNESDMVPLNIQINKFDSLA